MRQPPALRTLVAAAACLAAALAMTEGAGQSRAAPWPQWRGPHGTGAAPDADVPLRFGPRENVLWRLEVPGRGFSSPVVAGGRVLLTTAVATETVRRQGRMARRLPVDPVEHRFMVLAVDLASGRVDWERTATRTTPHEGYHPALSSFANASPVTDGERVYAFFGSRGLYAYDLDGGPLWSRDFDVSMQVFNRFGESSSPALYGDRIVVVFDHEGESFIEVVDKHTGATVWRRPRAEDTSWASPIVVSHGGRPQVVTSAGNFVMAYDLATGDELWRMEGMTPRPVPTPVAADGLLFAVSGTTERRVRVARLGGRGDLTGTPWVAWELDRAAPYNPSPLVLDDILYLVRDGGLQTGSSRLSAFEAASGRPHYLEKRLPRAATVKASPLGIGDRVYLCTEEGDVIVVRHGEKFDVLAVNDMGERFLASPAVAGDVLLLRSDRHLVAVGRE